MPAKSNLLESNYWDREWERWFDRYSLGYPRIGVWLFHKFGHLCDTYLELGAGSARESRYLAQFASRVTSVDFSNTVVEMIRNSNPPENFSAHVMNAFSLQFPGKAFDLSFHKGFWSCFASDEDIALLFREQLRVTKTYLIMLVHNALNTRMVADFAKKAEDDDLYKVRFFRPDELKGQLERELEAQSINATVRLGKFGGFNRIYKLPCPKVLRGFLDVLIVNAYRFLPWNLVESVVVEVKLGGDS